MTRLMRRMAPPPRLTLSQWADQYRFLSAENSAEPGRWRTSRAAYQRGIMDAISDPRVERVVLMTSARVGKTQVINNLVGYHIHQDPAPLLVVCPTTAAAEEWSKEELAPMLRDSPALRRKVAAPRSRDTANTVVHKQFPGGKLFIVGANAPSGLAAKTVRVVCADEVDRYPASAGTEGDPVALAIKRATTFWNRKIVLASTPTIDGASRIATAFAESDQRRFWVPCPHCDEPQVLRWENVRWPDGEPSRAAYHCGHCGAAWTDAERWRAIHQAEHRGGGWRAEGEFTGTAGFHLSELYSSWRRIAQTAEDFYAARGSAERMKVWVNTALGETYRERGDAPDHVKLAASAEDMPRGVVPGDVVVLTLTADVQGDRLEWDLWGWSPAMVPALVDSGVIEGRPTEPRVWSGLTELAQKTWLDVRGRDRRIDAVGVDSGYGTHEVYRWVMGQRQDFAFALDGRGDPLLPPLGTPSRRDVDFAGRKVGSVLVWPVGTHGLKLEHYEAVRRSIEGRGGLRLPRWAGEEYCAQLCSEFLATVQPRRGAMKRVWMRIKGIRNERLDTAVYGRALARHFTAGLSPEAWVRLAQDRAAEPDAAVQALTTRLAEVGQEPPPMAPPAPAPRAEPATPAAERKARRRDWFEPRRDWI